MSKLWHEKKIRQIWQTRQRGPPPHTHTLLHLPSLACYHFQKSLCVQLKKRKKKMKRRSGGWRCNAMSHPRWDGTFTPCNGSGLEWVTEWERLMERLAVTEGRWKSEIKYSSTAEPRTVRSFSGSALTGSPREPLASLTLSKRGPKNNMAAANVKTNAPFFHWKTIHGSVDHLSQILVIYCALARSAKHTAREQWAMIWFRRVLWRRSPSKKTVPEDKPFQNCSKSRKHQELLRFQKRQKNVKGRVCSVIRKHRAMKTALTDLLSRTHRSFTVLFKLRVWRWYSWKGFIPLTPDV